MHQIICERNSPSDEQMICIKVCSAAGEKVRKGEILFELEGAKAVFEVQAEVDGFFRPRISAGDIVEIGQTIGLILPSRQDIEQTTKIPDSDVIVLNAKSEEVLNRFTKSGKAFFVSLEDNLQETIRKKVEPNRIYTMEDLELLLASSTEVVSEYSIVQAENWRKFLEQKKGSQPLFFVGGGFGAIQALDLVLDTTEFSVEGFFSDYETNALDTVGIERLGKCEVEDISKILSLHKDAVFVNTVGLKPTFRLKVHSLLKHLDATMPNLIHPTAYISRNVKLGVGNLVFAGVYIGVDTTIGDANFISSNSVLEHHNIWGHGNCIGPNLSTSGLVQVGDSCRFGSGVVVEPKVKIGNSCVVASNTSVTKNLQEGAILKARH